MAPGSCSFLLQTVFSGLDLEPTRAGIEAAFAATSQPNYSRYFWQLSLTILRSVTRKWFDCEASPDALSPLPLDLGVTGVPVTVTVCPTCSPNCTVLL